MAKTNGVQTRELILREASQLFAERGFHGTSTRDIAEAVGIRQPSLFHHFKTKNDIMVALQEIELAQSAHLLETTSQYAASPAALLYSVVYLEVRGFLGSAYDFSGTTAAAVLNDPAFDKAKRRFGKIQDAHTALIAKGVAAGELIEIDPTIANRAVEWTIDGVLVDATRHSEIEAGQLAELLASFVVRSLLFDTGRLDAVRTEAKTLIAKYETLA